MCKMCLNFINVGNSECGGSGSAQKRMGEWCVDGV